MSTRSSDWIFPAICLILAVALIYVSYQNIALKRQLAEAVEQHGHLPIPPVASTGQPAPPFDVYLPDGQQFAIRTDSLVAPLVLAWLSWDCEPCLAAVETWNVLFDDYPGQLWGIANAPESDEDTAWVGRDIHFAIVNPIDDGTFRRYGISLTPQTMVIGAGGTIDGVWLGALDAGAIDSIKATLRQPFVERR